MATATSAPPANIGRHRIERTGAGRQWHRVPGVDGFRGRKVAIKADPRAPAQGARAGRALPQAASNEAALSGRLRHPNIVRLLDADEEALPPYLVLEYVDGQPLSDFATPTPCCPCPRCWTLPSVLQRARIRFTAKGLVHRDIKPANLMLARGGDEADRLWRCCHWLQRCHPAVPAWWVAVVHVAEQVREQDLTHQRHVLAGRGGVRGLLTGRRPFDGDTDFATLYKISNDAHAAQPVARVAASACGRSAAACAGCSPLDRLPPGPTLPRHCWLHTKGLPARSRKTPGRALCPPAGAAVFADFHDVAPVELMRLGSWRRLEAGTVLMRENTPGDSFPVSSSKARWPSDARAGT